MKKDRINTSSVREIKHSFKRFLSLLVMSMLGVGVFVGIKMTAPDMMKSLDKYYDDNDFYDIKIVSTLGLTKDDIKAFKDLKTVKKAYGSYSKDVLVEAKNKELVVKLIGINQDVNKIEILKGRYPKDNTEVIVEQSMINKEKLKIGDYITVNDDILKNKKLKIVGIVKSPLYITSETGTANRGNTNIGTGKINYYAYTNNDNFNIDYYTEIYLTVNGASAETTNSDKYNNIIEKSLKEIDKIKKDREDLRYSKIYDDANNKIKEEQENGQEKLDDAKNALDSANNKLKDGKNKLNSSKLELDNAKISLDDTKNKLDNAKKELDDNKIKLDNAKRQIEIGKNEINNKLSSYGITIDDINTALDYINNPSISKNVIINAIPDNILFHDEIVDIINKIYDLGLQKEFIEFIKDPVNNKDDLISKIPPDTPGYNEIIIVINYISSNSNLIKDYITNTNNIDFIIASIPKDIPNYDEVVKILTLYKENYSDLINLITAIDKINSAEKEYQNGLSLYNNAIEKYNNGYKIYLNYYNDYQNGLSLYNNSYRTYRSSLELFNSKLKEYYDSKAMFDLKIKDAKDKLNEISKAVLYIYDRLDDSGYSSFIDDGNSVSNLSKVFPTIFFIVAILISLISMSRMVEDDRGVIGTLKSLGFSNKHIRRKYLLYSGLATISGGILGALLGFFLLPKYIWKMYKIIFDIPVFKYDFNPINFIIGILIATICICGTTLLTIRKVVKEKPSELMRPKAPSNGKRVILERIPFIWKRINFSNKITVRNLFRYKKRVFMTVGGILGCTALMLSGFGIRDSIVEIPDKQYDGVFKFDEMIYVMNKPSKEELDKIFDNKHIVKRLDTNMIVSMTSNNININIFVPFDEKDMREITNLKELNTGEKLKLKDNEVVISDKLSQLIKKNKGDKIIIKDSNNKEYTFIISGICENYVSHYVFMNKKTYEDNIGTYETNITYLKIDNLKNEEKLSRQLLKDDNVMSIMSVNQTIKGVNDMLKSLNSVVLILIVLSGALSFVVLYNLSYINISERKREIATLKVLGFTDKEVDDYIVKETIILTIMGIAFGLIFGIFLTNIIVDTIEIEIVRFIHQIKLSSYLITAFMIMLFTIIVSIIIHFALKKIDMIESLKSVE